MKSHSVVSFIYISMIEARRYMPQFSMTVCGNEAITIGQQRQLMHPESHVQHAYYYSILCMKYGDTTQVQGPFIYTCEDILHAIMWNATLLPQQLVKDLNLSNIFLQSVVTCHREYTVKQHAICLFNDACTQSLCALHTQL